MLIDTSSLLNYLFRNILPTSSGLYHNIHGKISAVWEIEGSNIYGIHTLHNHFAKHIILNKEEEYVKMVVINGL
jgi:hypothetical protein